MSLEEELEYYKDAYNTLLSCMPGAYIIYNEETGRINRVGTGLLEMLGVDEDTFREQYYNNFDLMIIKQDRELVKQQLRDQLLYTESTEVNFRMRGPVGEIRYINYRGRRMHDRNLGDVVFAFLTDDSDSVMARQEIQRVNERLAIETRRYQLLQETTDDMPIHYIVDADAFMMTLHEESGRREVTVGNFLAQKRLTEFVYPEDLSKVTTSLNKALGEAVKSSIDVRLMLPSNGDRSYSWYRIYYASFTDHYGRIGRIMGTLKNINGEKEEQEALRSMARMDAMTGLLNKTAVGNAISEELAKTEQGQKHALLIIDADHFKTVNDTLGHLYGDKVICNIARELRKTFRDSDYIGRIGGDEFVVLMRGADMEIASQRARSLNETLHQVYEQNGTKVTVSLSIGIAVYPEHGSNYMTLYAQADTALYRAKEAGRNCFRVCGQKEE